MIKKLLTLANKLDNAGLHKEADYLDAIIKTSYSKKQMEVFDGDGDGKPFEKEDFSKLRNDSKDSATDLIECPNCGTLNDNTNTHCSNCGTKL
jgi:hypothetical protein